MERETRIEVDEIIKNCMYNRGITVDSEVEQPVSSVPSHSFNMESKTTTESPPVQQSYDLSKQNQVLSEDEEDVLPF